MKIKICEVDLLRPSMRYCEKPNKYSTEILWNWLKWMNKMSMQILKLCSNMILIWENGGKINVCHGKKIGKI